MSKKSLPKELTSYDLLKTVAVVLMIVDHLGYYFFPEEGMFRVFGRFCVPIWFFLIGYAQTRDFRIDWSVGCLILVGASLLTQGYVLPLNIIGTMIVVRLVIDKVAFITFRNLESLLYTVILGALLYIPSGMLTEYGTLGLLLALVGYMARHNDEIKLSKEQKAVFFVGVLAAAFYYQQQIAMLDIYGKSFLAFGLTGVMTGLLYFKSVRFAALTEKMPSFMVLLLQLTGRRTMEIYVVHLLLFKVIATYIGMPGFGWQEWTIFYHGIEGTEESLLSESTNQ